MPQTTAPRLFLVIERDEDGITTQWRVVFPSLQDALSAVEAAHQEEWAHCGMEGDDQLTMLPCGEDECVLTLADRNIDWRSWTVTEAKMAD